MEFRLFLLLALAPSALAGTSTLDNLAGTWNDLDGFASIGQCISAPSDIAHVLCSPAQLSDVDKGRFEGRGTVSATDSVLDLSDKLRKDEITAGDINSLFRDYNYTDVLLNVDLNYVGHNFLVGVKPVRYQGQFEVHNPNLPFASLAFRDDRDVHVGGSYSVGGDRVRWSFGSTASLLFREESLFEGTVVELAARPAKELVDRQKLSGYFFDAGTSLEFNNLFTIAVLGKDMGDWFGGKRDHVNRYLFIKSDKVPKIFFSVSALPRLAGGRLQVGVSTVRFVDEKNSFDKQWFTTLSYFVGPFRLLSGWRPNLFRTGLAVRFSRFEANVAQEWINTLEDGRKPQPRFTLEVTSGL